MAPPPSRWRCECDGGGRPVLFPHCLMPQVMRFGHQLSRYLVARASMVRQTKKSSSSSSSSSSSLACLCFHAFSIFDCAHELADKLGRCCDNAAAERQHRQDWRPNHCLGVRSCAGTPIIFSDILAADSRFGVLEHCGAPRLSHHDVNWHTCSASAMLMLIAEGLPQHQSRQCTQFADHHRPRCCSPRLHSASRSQRQKPRCSC